MSFNLNPSASAFFPYDPRSGVPMIRSQHGAHAIPIPMSQPLQQPHPMMYQQQFANGAGMPHHQQAHLIDPTCFPVLVTTPTLTPLHTGVAPPTPTLTLTPGGPSSPSMSNLASNMPHLVLQPVFPTQSPRTGAHFGSSPLVAGLAGTPNLALTPGLFSSPAFSTVATIASPLTPTMGGAPTRLDQLHLGSAALTHTESPRLLQASFQGGVVGSRTGPHRPIVTPPLNHNTLSPKANHLQGRRGLQQDLSENEVPQRLKKMSRGQIQNRNGRTAPTADTPQELPPPMLSADDANVTRSMQIQPPNFQAYQATPPMTAMPMTAMPMNFIMPQQLPPLIQQPTQLLMVNPQYQQLQTAPSLQTVEAMMSQSQQPPSVGTVQSMSGGARSTSSGGSVRHPAMNALPPNVLSPSEQPGSRGSGLPNADGAGLSHSSSAPSLHSLAIPKQFSSDLLRQYSANDTEFHRKQHDADLSTRSQLISTVLLKVVEKDRTIPREVVWLVGPPSSGRSTLARYVCQLRGFTVNGEHATIDMDNVWRIISERYHQDQIQKFKPLEEAQTLLETVLKSQSTNGLVIDGYLTKQDHVSFVKEMFHYFRSIRPTVRFAFVLLDCTEEQITNRWRTKHNIPRNRRSQQKSKELNAWRRRFQEGVDLYNQVRTLLMSEYDIQPISADHNIRAVQRDLEQELSRRRHGEVRSEARFVDDASSGHGAYGSYSAVHTPMSEGPYRASTHIQHSHRRYGSRERNGNNGGNGPGVNGNSSASSTSSRVGSSPSRGDRHGRFKVQRSITHTVMSKITQRVRQRVIEMIYPRVPRHDSMRTSSLFHRLPAKFPVTMSQIRLDQIKRNDYWVSEKTDGVRYLMYIEKQHSQRRERRRQPRSGDDGKTPEEFNCYLIDRKFFICRVCGDLYISGQDNDALLDGEFVTIEDENGNERPIFIVFDAVQVSHLNIAKNAYSVRHQHIRNLVDRIPRAENEQFPLQIMYKPLIEASRLQDVMSKIRYDEQRHKYVHDGVRGLVTLNDGLTFMPEHSPYLPSEHDLPVVKWKWKELNTVDLLAREPFLSRDDALVLYCQGDGNNLVQFQSKRLSSEHRAMFDRLLQKATESYSSSFHGKNGKKHKNGPLNDGVGSPPPEFIVECVWDPEFGMWCPKWLRLDKDTPNYIKVAKAINRDLSEFISPETLVEALSREEVSQAVLNLGLRAS